MCIAIFKPADKEITRETLETCFKANSHGCGFAYINESYTGDRKIIIKKTLDFETFYRQYTRALRVNPESPFIIHFRIKTHGPVNKDNCHPFRIDEETAFIHNGTISGVGTDPAKSDTRLFNEKILKKLPAGWEYEDHYRALIEDFISYSKLVVLNIDGDVQIYNEGKGKWDGGIWYSNDSYKPRTPYVGYKNTASPYEPCDECGTWHNKHAMSCFYNLGEFQRLCKGCVKKDIKAGYLYDSDRISNELYETYVDVEVLEADTLLYNYE